MASDEEIKIAAKRLLDVLENNGEWDDGCFFFCRRSHPELETPMKSLAEALKATEQPIGHLMTKDEYIMYAESNAKEAIEKLHEVERYLDALAPTDMIREEFRQKTARIYSALNTACKYAEEANRLADTERPKK